LAGVGNPSSHFPNPPDKNSQDYQASSTERRPPGWVQQHQAPAITRGAGAFRGQRKRKRSIIVGLYSSSLGRESRSFEGPSREGKIPRRPHRPSFGKWDPPGKRPLKLESRPPYSTTPPPPPPHQGHSVLAPRQHQHQHHHQSTTPRLLNADHFTYRDHSIAKFNCVIGQLRRSSILSTVSNSERPLIGSTPRSTATPRSRLDTTPDTDNTYNVGLLLVGHHPGPAAGPQ